MTSPRPPAALEGVTTLVHAAAITANLKEPYPGAYRLINETGPTM